MAKSPERASAIHRASCRIRTNDPVITNHVLWPAELKRQGGQANSHRVATTHYLCYVPVLEDSRGADRARLARICGCKVSQKLSYNILPGEYFGWKGRNLPAMRKSGTFPTDQRPLARGKPRNLEGQPCRPSACHMHAPPQGNACLPTAGTSTWRDPATAEAEPFHETGEARTRRRSQFHTILWQSRVWACHRRTFFACDGSPRLHYEMQPQGWQALQSVTFAG